jgi:hypothetical protein
MTIRDPLFDEEYFEGYIADRQKEIDKWADKLASRASWSDKDNSGLYVKLAANSNRLLNALYSSARPTEEMKPVFSKWIHYETKIWHINPSGIGIALFLEIGNLLGYTDEDRVTIQHLIDITWNKDPYAMTLSRAAGFEYPTPDSDKSSRKYYNEVMALGTKEEREAFTADYLKRRWYQSKRSLTMYNSHKLYPVYAYFGYWAFDVAAMVRAMELDDSSFIDNRYYPVELAHYLDR